MNETTTKKWGEHFADTQQQKPGYTDKTDALYLTGRTEYLSKSVAD